MDDDEDSGRPRIDTWEMLKKELRDQFLPTNATWVAREALKKLKHVGSVRDYVKSFFSLMLDIRKRTSSSISCLDCNLGHTPSFGGKVSRTSLRQ